MSDRNNQKNDDAWAFLLGAGAAALGVTLATAAVRNAQENEAAARRSRQNGNSEVTWGQVFGTIGTIAGGVMAAHEFLNEVTNDASRAQPSRSTLASLLAGPSAAEEREQQQNCGICSHAMWGGARELSCNHRFHTVCIRKWKENNDRCPTCGRRVQL